MLGLATFSSYFSNRIASDLIMDEWAWIGVHSGPDGLYYWMDGPLQTQSLSQEFEVNLPSYASGGVKLRGPGTSYEDGRWATQGDWAVDEDATLHSVLCQWVMFDNNQGKIYLQVADPAITTYEIIYQANGPVDVIYNSIRDLLYIADIGSLGILAISPQNTNPSILQDSKPRFYVPIQNLLMFSPVPTVAVVIFSQSYSNKSDIINFAAYDTMLNQRFVLLERVGGQGAMCECNGVVYVRIGDLGITRIPITSTPVVAWSPTVLSTRLFDSIALSHANA
jgi:hypothetical protein